MKLCSRVKALLSRKPFVSEIDIFIKDFDKNRKDKSASEQLEIAKAKRNSAKR